MNKKFHYQRIQCYTIFFKALPILRPYLPPSQKTVDKRESTGPTNFDPRDRSVMIVSSTRSFYTDLFLYRVDIDRCIIVIVAGQCRSGSPHTMARRYRSIDRYRFAHRCVYCFSPCVLTLPRRALPISVARRARCKMSPSHRVFA